MQKTRIIVYITAPRKGLFLSMAKMLSAEHDVWILSRDAAVKGVVLDKLPEMADKVLLRPNPDPALTPAEIVRECVAREEKYGELFSMIMSHDRALGQGYFFNADRHPHIRRSFWPKERKLREVLQEFLSYEEVVARYRPDVIIADSRPLSFDLIMQHAKGYYLAPVIARIADRYYWAENRYDTSRLLLEQIRRYVDRAEESRDPVFYEEYERHTTSLRAMDFSFRRAVRDASYQTAKDVYKRLRGFRKRDSYVFGAWVAPAIRRAISHRYFSAHGVKPLDVTGKKIVCFPLHMEPETALLRLAPEFNNSEEIISWVSRSIPADAYLVIKENPWSFGIRSMDYYHRLRKIGNVLLAHPEASSADWLKVSKLIVSISGTVGFEAVYFRRPVLSFGAHQPINLLPTVRFADSYGSTREALKELLRMAPEEELFGKAKQALHQALMSVSFRLPGLGSLLQSTELRMDLAENGLRRLYQDYPHLFGEWGDPAGDFRPEERK